MINTILLLTPIYVTLFWAVVLNIENRNHSEPQIFLGKFMLFACWVYLSHFFFFTQHTGIYIFMDALYQYASLMVYPMFYVYVRLLTIDKHFSIKKHGRYFLASAILLLLYLVGILLTPIETYRDFILGKKDFGSMHITYLQTVTILMRITFLVQIILSVIGSYKLIEKYKHRAKQYYSDMEDSRMNKMQLLNISMIILGCSSFILGMLGRTYFVNERILIACASVIFSSLLFVIGYLGSRQSVINPTYELSGESQAILPSDANEAIAKEDDIKEKLHCVMEKEKIFLNSKITIRDMARAIGTNRTYLSVYINKNYNQNFCSFVNEYRLNYMKKILQKQPAISISILSETCGFGSVDSLKRSVYAKYGISFGTWRKQVISDNNANAAQNH